MAEHTTAIDFSPKPLQKYRCYICGYWSWEERLPSDFENETAHKSCAKNLRQWEHYHNQRQTIS